jgi:hypothetical protein
MSNNKFIGVVGLVISVAFVAGLGVLFILNPKTFDELDNLSLFVYNLEGMDGRLWAVFVIYLAVGILNVLFAVGLFIKVENKPPIVFGKILLLLSGMVWLSFGLFSYNTQMETGAHLFLVRVIALILTSALSLIFLGVSLIKFIGIDF